mgnify:CR=1 FL=1
MCFIFSDNKELIKNIEKYMQEYQPKTIQETVPEEEENNG